MATITRRAGATLPLIAAACLLWTTAHADASLYGRMGGRTVVTAVVNETIDDVVADRRINQSFDGVNLARLKRLLVEQICSLTGGGCTYTGSDMKDAHAGLHITEAEFYGMVAILRASLRSHHVGLRERNELLALLAPMERDVVERSKPKPRPTALPPVAARARS